MKELSNTQFFQVESAPQIQAKDILEIVYKSLVHNFKNIFCTTDSGKRYS